jgi:hypothetical protein
VVRAAAFLFALARSAFPCEHNNTRLGLRLPTRCVGRLTHHSAGFQLSTKAAVDKTSQNLGGGLDSRTPLFTSDHRLGRRVRDPNHNCVAGRTPGGGHRCLTKMPPLPGCEQTCPSGTKLFFSGVSPSEPARWPQIKHGRLEKKMR